MSLIFFFDSVAPPTAPARPASPLPPNVPTGPRNQNKYKDRDGNAPAVDGLDYGGGRDARDARESSSRRTPSGEPEERISSRYVVFRLLPITWPLTLLIA